MKKLTLVVLMILNLLMMGGCMQDKNHTTKKEARQNMKNYLETTYGKKFEVEKVKTAGSWGMGYYYSAIAYPEENKDLKFSIRCSKARKTDYPESYLSTKWTIQGKQEIEKKVKELYGEDVYVVFRFPYKNIKFKDLDFSEVLKRSDGEPSMDVDYYIFTDKSIDKKGESEKAFKLFKEYILNNGIKMYSFNVSYYIKELKTDFENNTAYKRVILNETLDKSHNDNKLINLIHLDNFRSRVTNTQDIKNNFRY